MDGLSFFPFLLDRSFCRANLKRTNSVLIRGTNKVPNESFTENLLPTFVFFVSIFNFPAVSKFLTKPKTHSFNKYYTTIPIATRKRETKHWNILQKEIHSLTSIISNHVAVLFVSSKDKTGTIDAHTIARNEWWRRQ